MIVSRVIWSIVCLKFHLSKKALMRGSSKLGYVQFLWSRSETGVSISEPGISRLWLTFSAVEHQVRGQLTDPMPDRRYQ